MKKWRRGALEFLVSRFDLLGFDGQNWMLIMAGLIAAFILFTWEARQRVEHLQAGYSRERMKHRLAALTRNPARVFKNIVWLFF